MDILSAILNLGATGRRLKCTVKYADGTANTVNSMLGIGLKIATNEGIRQCVEAVLIVARKVTALQMQVEIKTFRALPAATARCSQAFPALDSR